MDKERNYIRAKALYGMAADIDSWLFDTKEEQAKANKLVKALVNLANDYQINSVGYEDEYGKALAEYYGYNK